MNAEPHSRKIAFVSCEDLSRYFPSKKNPLLTHDDQIACDYLEEQGWQVDALPWGRDLDQVLKEEYELLLVRSPWDYMDSEENRKGFFHWLQGLARRGARIANPYEILLWSLDKHYLKEFEQLSIATVPTVFIETDQSLELLIDAQKTWGQIVVKPCISAAAKDTFLIRNQEDLEDLCLGRGAFLLPFESLRKGRAFMVQPFIKDIESKGEWSLVFLNGTYSHAVLKLPKKGHWLVQDELGGSVHCLEAPDDVRAFAESAFQKIRSHISDRFRGKDLLYARVDVVPGNLLGELELVEPELFFLDRRTDKPNLDALKKFHQGIENLKQLPNE